MKLWAILIYRNFQQPQSWVLPPFVFDYFLNEKHLQTPSVYDLYHGIKRTLS